MLKPSKMDKIVIFTKWFPNKTDPQLGVFIEKHVACIAKNYEVEVIHICADGKNIIRPFVNEKESNFILQQYYYPSRNLIWSILMQCALYLKAIWRIKNKKKIIALHSYIIGRSTIISFLLSKIWQKPFVISEQHSAFATGKFNMKPWLLRKLYRKIFKKADAVSTVSIFLKTKMEASAFDNVNWFITPNVVHEISNQDPPIDPFQFKWLVVADLVDEIKNISGTLKAFHKVLETLPHHSLTIVGGGKDAKRLLDMVNSDLILKEKVIFTGLLPNHRVLELLNYHHAIIVNSRFETFSAICIESLAAGRPVIATRCGGPNEILDSSVGILIDVDANDQLIKAMHSMSSNYSQYPSQVLKKYIQHRYSFSHCNRIFGDMYQKAIANYDA
jgi:glycosyltransferase involved in cell wall biosynthesis